LVDHLSTPPAEIGPDVKSTENEMAKQATLGQLAETIEIGAGPLSHPVRFGTAEINWRYSMAEVELGQEYLSRKFRDDLVAYLGLDGLRRLGALPTP
jgi:hypothetical protein